MPQAPSPSRSQARAAANDLTLLLSSIRHWGEGVAEEKLELLQRLEHATLPSADEVFELHEAACFLRAYPDSKAVLEAACRILEGFSERSDLSKHRDDLRTTGIHGTDTHFAYYWFTTCLLMESWSDRMTIDWKLFENAGKLEELMPLLLAEHETLALEETELTLRELVHTLKGKSETDAAFVVSAFRKLRADPMLREKLFDDLVVPLVLASGPDTPSRTLAAFPVRRLAFQTTPPHATKRVKKSAFREAPKSVRQMSRGDGETLVWLARESMMTRERDLFAFVHADPEGVLLVDYGAGLQFACIGIVPKRRGLLYAMYVILALKNGVPVGYVQASTLFESAEVNFNVFDTFRAAEASRIFIASLAMMHHVFAAKTFSINTQQLGEDNPEALHTGAWWFYHKHGFRPDGAELRALAKSELARRRRDPSHRSTIGTLRELSAEPLFLDLDRRRPDAIGRLDISRIGSNISRRISQRFDCAHTLIARRCQKEVGTLLGVRDTSSWPREERYAWNRWAPLAIALAGIEAWTPSERRALVRVVRAKGRRREADFVRLFDEHNPLRRAVQRLARELV